jgi:hypothetical protein
METITAKKIHSEFDAACDKMLEVIRPSEKEIETINNLKSIGFDNCINAKEIETLQENNAVYKKALYYKEKYPFLKFITEDTFFGICRKYNLIYAPVKNYTGSVPEKNVAEIIENQHVFDEDLAETKRMYFYPSNDIYHPFITEVKIEKNRQLFIAADKSQFNLENLEKSENGLGFFNPDPIVFRYVKDGILIISKWGDEANDLELVVPELN